MNIDNLMQKLTDIAYKNAELIGVGGGALAFGWDGLMDSINRASTGQVHFPDLQTTIYDFVSPSASAGQKNMDALKWYLIGWSLKEIGIGSKIGGAIQDIAVGFVKGNAVQHVLHAATHSDGADHGLGGGSHFGFLSGSHHSPVGAYTEPSVAPYGTKLTRSGRTSPSPYA